MNPSQRLDFIDFGKGFAILSIVLFHYFLPYASGLAVKALMLGGAGVHIFPIIELGVCLSRAKKSAVVFFKGRLKSL